MTHDAALEFNLEDGNAITADATLGDLDLGYSDIGTGNPLFLIVSCIVDGTGAGTVNYQLRTADTTAGLAAGDIIVQSGEIVGTDHNAGEQLLAIPLPTGKVKARVRLRAEVTGTVGAAQVRAWIGSEPQNGLGIRTPITASA